MKNLVTFLVCCCLAFLVVPVSTARADSSSAAAQQQAASVVTLKRLFLAESEEAVMAIDPSSTDQQLVIKGVPLLENAEFRKLMASFFGMAINDSLAQALTTAIGDYTKKNDRLVIDVLVPKQNASDGTVRLGVVIGKFKNLAFMGNRWFSGRLLYAKLGIKPGDEIRLSTLEEAVNWANTNPFRRVKVLINDLPTEPGKADLMVAVQEKFPIKIAAAYDNSGSAVLGKNHYSGSVEYGNLWGLDHQISYSYLTTDYRKLYQVHNFDYRIPLPWRHTIQINGAYADVRPTFGWGWFNQKGESIIGSVRYLMAKEKGIWSTECAIGAEYKQSNNNLEFGGYQLQDTKNDIFQATLSTTLGRRDPVGVWIFGANFNFSPGNINSRNTDDNYHSTRFNSRARYYNATFQVQRLTNLPFGFDMYSRAQLQWSSTNLLGSEQLTIGGQGTVRGYRERILAGDEGYVITHELQGPMWHFAMPKTQKDTPPMQLRLLAFWDSAKVYYNEPLSSDVELDTLMSAGLGLRANMSYNFNLSADWGWQLKKTTEPQPRRSRGHLRISFVY